MISNCIILPRLKRTRPQQLALTCHSNKTGLSSRNSSSVIQVASDCERRNHCTEKQWKWPRDDTNISSSTTSMSTCDCGKVGSLGTWVPAEALEGRLGGSKVPQ